MGKIISFEKEKAKYEQQIKKGDIILQTEEELDDSIEQYLEEYIDETEEDFFSENKKQNKETPPEPVFMPLSEEEKAVLVWFYCPHCKSLEYSEISLEGRIHKCETKMLEKEVVIDITAEYTVCKRNLSFLERIEQDLEKNIAKEKEEKQQQNFIVFKELIKGLKDIELAMIDTLKKISCKKELTVYIWNKNDPKLIASINSFGLAISNFHFQPESRFKK